MTKAIKNYLGGFDPSGFGGATVDAKRGFVGDGMKGPNLG